MTSATLLALTEAIVRQFQYCEYEVKKKLEAKKSVDHSEWFLGRARRLGGAVIHPELLKFVADFAARESSILKEQSKFAAERKLKPG